MYMYTLIPFTNQANVLGAGDAVDVSRFGQDAAFLLERLQIPMAMDLRSIGVEAGDEFPVILGSEVFLTPDDNDLVRPYCLLESLDVVVFVGVSYQAS